MKSFQKRLKYLKLCLISPALEIVINIIYISSFIILFTYFYIEGKYYNDNQILKFTESYIDYNSFNSIDNDVEFISYLSDLINKLYTININTEKLPIFIPLNPIRLSQFSNKGCKEDDFNYSCDKSFTCVIDSLATSFKHSCGLRYTGNINEFNADEISTDEFEDLKKKKENLFLENIVASFPGYYSKYDLLNGGRVIDFTNKNYAENEPKIQRLIRDKNLKFIALQINLKVPSNNNYVDIILGLEMNQYFHNKKKIISIDVFNGYRPSKNTFLFTIYIFFIVSTIINIVKLIYEMMIKIVVTVHIISLINEIFNILLLIFEIFYIIIDLSLSLEPDLNKFETHLIYSTVRKIMKIIFIFVLISMPLRFVSLLSWWKWISYPFVKIIKVLFRMLPGIFIIFIIIFFFLIFFAISNYLIFQDIFSEYQSFYYSFLNMFNYKLLNKLYDKDNNAKIFHNLTYSKYIFIILLKDYIFFLISFGLLIATFVYLFKKANAIESPEIDNQYMLKLKQIENKLKENISKENIDLIGIKKQILWLKLSNQSSNLSDSTSYEIILFKNSNQIIAFLRYLFALKPELQFKNLVKKLNIVVEVSNYNKNMGENEVLQIDKLIEWMTFVGCKILVIVYCQMNFAVNFQMKLYSTYNYIKFINNKHELEKIINEKDYGKFNIVNDSGFSIYSLKENNIQN
jgi:hypothetical protein